MCDKSISKSSFDRSEFVIMHCTEQTVTSRLIVPESTSEAVSAIVLHTDRAADLLRRYENKIVLNTALKEEP